jgi:mevalonate kinase
VSAPGKLILMGEHAVVYGRPALVAAIDLRLHARFSPPAEPGSHPGAIRLALPRLGLAGELSWRAVRDYAREACERWERYAAEPGPESFRALRGKDPLHLVKVALGEAAAALDPGGEGDEPLDLAIESELPIGSGMGSSAAAAVAVVAGYSLWRDAGQDLGALLPEIERLAHEVERRQHGTPSGVDAATVARGGLLWAQRIGGTVEGISVEPLAARSPLLQRIAVYDTGTPAEATGAVVAAVRERAGCDAERHARLLDRIEEATRGLRAELAAESEDPLRVVELLRAGHSGLAELGVVPAAVGERVRQVEAAGGAAKISGAGALSGAAAGTLLAYHPQPNRLAALPALALPRYPVHPGAAGLRREEIR